MIRELSALATSSLSISAKTIYTPKHLSKEVYDFVRDNRLDVRVKFLQLLLEGNKDTQDPDVLDTWFSSGLWPHSTLGWPDQTPDLKWYPGNVLVTSREIITLWVARMVMLGMYNMGQKSSSLISSPGTPGEGQGEGISSLGTPGDDKGGGSDDALARQLGIPFHHVYIHTTILDGHGERMSKSKGNGVDPVEVIETNGADSLRFTLTNMATETQDVRLPVKKDAQGRNTSENSRSAAASATKSGRSPTTSSSPNLGK